NRERSRDRRTNQVKRPNPTSRNQPEQKWRQSSPTASPRQRRNHPPLKLITQHHDIRSTRHRTPDPPNQHNQLTSNIFQHSKKNSEDKSTSGGPGPGTSFLCPLPLGGRPGGMLDRVLLFNRQRN